MPTLDREERADGNGPSDRRAGKTRHDHLNEQQRREPERKRCECERAEDDRVEQPVLLAEMDEVGQHVRRIR